MSSAGESAFEIAQYNYTVYASGGVYLVLSFFFLGNYYFSKTRIHLILFTSSFLSFVSSFLYLFSRPLISISNSWLYILEGQWERVTELGAFAVYLIFVISRLTLVRQGVQRWQKILDTLIILFLLAHLIRQAFQDIDTVSGNPSISGDIGPILLMVSMLYFFGINFSLNYFMIKCITTKALRIQQGMEAEYKCKRLQMFLYGSITSTALGCIILNIDWDYHNLPLFHSMNTLGNVAIAGHFYFEWLFQVLLADILRSQCTMNAAPKSTSVNSSPDLDP